jgi:hypothetical protein
MLIVFPVKIKPFLVVVLLKILEKADGRRAEHDAKLTFCRETKTESDEVRADCIISELIQTPVRW